MVIGDDESLTFLAGRKRAGTHRTTAQHHKKNTITMITLRGKLTRTLVARPLPIPKATRSSSGTVAVVADANHPPPPPVTATVSGTAATADAAGESNNATANNDKGIPAYNNNSEEGINTVEDVVVEASSSSSSSSITVLAKVDEKSLSARSSELLSLFPGKETIATNNNTIMGEGHAQESISDGRGQGAVDEEEQDGQIMMTMEEWTWRGIWAFGDLAEEEEQDKEEGKKDVGDNDDKTNNDDHRENVVTNEEEKNSSSAVVPNDAKIAVVDNNTLKHDEVATREFDSSKVLEINENCSNHPTYNSKSTTEREVSSPVNPTNISTLAAAASSNEVKIDNFAPTKNRPGRKKKKQRRSERPRLTAAEILAEAEAAAKKPRPFLYKWLKPVNASEVAVPSAMVILVREMEGGGDGGGMDEEGAGTEEKKEPSSAEKDSEENNACITSTTTAAGGAIETRTEDGEATRIVEDATHAKEKTFEVAVETSKKEDGVIGGGKTAMIQNDVVMLEAGVNVTNTNKDNDGESLMKSTKIDETLPSSDNSQKSERIDTARDDAGIAIVTATANNDEPTTIERMKTEHTQPSIATSRKPTNEMTVTTYGDAPFTDASVSYPLGTCPKSGKWEGHFENVVANTSSSATSSSSHSKKKRSHSRSADSRVREVFYLFFNATPPHDARHTFSDTDSTIIANEMLDDKTSTNIENDGESTMEDDVPVAKTDTEGSSDNGKADGLLPSSHIHVRGYGTNRFGTFEIVGLLNPTTGTLKCQRMYVPVPTSAEISKIYRKDVRLSGRFILPGENEDGGGRRTAGRKRKSSWKKRESDIDATGSGGEYVLGPDGNLVWTSGSGGAVGIGSEGRQGSGAVDIASIVKKRPRLSYERTSSNRSAASSGGGILKPPPQCRATDNGPNLQISSGYAMFAPGAKPSPRAIPTIGGGAGAGAGSTKSHNKKSKGVTVAGAQPRSSSTYKELQSSMILTPPPAVIPTLPAGGDPMLARWRAAHYLYFQRVEQEPDGEEQGLSWASTTPASSGGKSSPSSAVRVKVNYVVYEGEMHDGMRDGRGICLYNNNTLYEGQWKKNKEHGIGKLMTADRKYTIYEGSWEKGKMHGHGTYAYYLKSGNGPPKENGKYVGQFRQSLRNGHGVYTLPNGSVFDGEFRDNIQNGYGIFRWPDGSIYEGPWRDGKRHGAHGILVASDGFRYEGSWVNNSMEGRGEAVYPKGQIYDGTWVAGRREGRGTIRFTNGAVCEFCTCEYCCQVLVDLSLMSRRYLQPHYFRRGSVQG